MAVLEMILGIFWGAMKQKKSEDMIALLCSHRNKVKRDLLGVQFSHDLR